jgi:hypothetical protein
MNLAASSLGDAATLLVIAQDKNDPGEAREARIFVDNYWYARENGEPEPFPGADGQAADISYLAGEIERGNAQPPEPPEPPLPEPTPRTPENIEAAIEAAKWWGEVFSIFKIF